MSDSLFCSSKRSGVMATDLCPDLIGSIKMIISSILLPALFAVLSSKVASKWLMAGSGLRDHLMSLV